MDEVLARALPRPRIPALNLWLFLATLATTLYMGSEYAGAARPALGGLGVRALAEAGWRMLVAGLPFAAALIAILLSHEMGHYLLARRHRVDATLPFFIPFPFGAGTLGAVIRIRSPMPSRRATLQIGAAGPIAGFAVALPLLLWGFAHSQVVADAASARSLLSPLGWVLSRLGFLPAGGDDAAPFFGDSLATLAATWLSHGRLAPGTTLALHPVAFAAWLGSYITALNLIPQGQLDGGHVVYALLGRERARRVSAVASAALLLLGLTVSWMWACWWVVTRFVVGTRHPPALLEEPLGTGGRALAVGALLLLVLTFVPMPLS